MRVGSVFVLAALLIAPTPAAAGRRRVAPGPAESDYLRAARETANWLSSLEKPVPPDGLSWPVSVASPATSAGIDAGAAGIGFFFLRLHEVTGEEVYLDKARRAANFVDASIGSATATTGYDWLAGIAGQGSFVLAVYRATGEERYLTAARNAGDWLVAREIRSGPGIYWKFSATGNIYTGVAHGAAGVSLFLLDLYDATLDPKYLDTAQGAFEWLMQYTMTAGNGYVWKRLTTDTATYPGWCGGTSGIVYFLDRLSRTTGDARHRDALERTAQGLLSTAIDDGDGTSKWDFYGPNTGYGIIYCHGASSVAAALADLYLVTGDDRMREEARAAARFVAEKGIVRESVGDSWNHFYGSSTNHYTGWLLGAASAGHMFLRLYRVDPDSAYLDLARGAAAYLLAIADHPVSGQSRWINFTSPPNLGEAPATYETGWYTGAAGIGLFFLELDQALHGRQPSEIFSGVNP